MCVCVGVSSLFRFSGHRSPPSHFFVFINRTCAGIHDLGLCVCVCVCFSLLLLLVVLIGRCCILFVMPSFSSFFFFFCSHIVCIKRLLVVNRRHLLVKVIYMCSIARVSGLCVYMLCRSAVIVWIWWFTYFVISLFFFILHLLISTRANLISWYIRQREKLPFFLFPFFLTSDFPHRQRRDAWRWPTQQTLQKWRTRCHFYQSSRTRPRDPTRWGSRPISRT